jgi:hypothetical protein
MPASSSLRLAAPEGAPCSRPTSRRYSVAASVPAIDSNGARFEAVGRGPDLEGRQCVERRGLAVQRAEVRPEPFVRAADQEVGVQCLDIDRRVRRVGDGIDIGQCPDLMRPRDDLADRVDRPDSVARIADGDELRPRGQLRLEVLEIERHVVLADIHLADGETAVGGHALPGADVRLVVERRDDDLVAGPQRGADAPPDMERERRHVVAELDLVRAGGSEEVGDSRVRFLGHRVGRLARRERAAVVGVGVGQVAGDRVDDALRDLGAAGSVEEGDRSPVLGMAERRELGPECVDVEHGSPMIRAVRSGGGRRAQPGRAQRGLAQRQSGSSAGSCSSARHVPVARSGAART